MKLPSLAEVRKTLVAAAAVLAQVVELGVLHGSALHYAQVASSVAGLVLVYLVPNARPKPATTAVPFDVIAKDSADATLAKVRQAAFDLTKVQHPDAETPAVPPA